MTGKRKNLIKSKPRKRRKREVKKPLEFIENTFAGEVHISQHISDGSPLEFSVTEIQKGVPGRWTTPFITDIEKKSHTQRVKTSQMKKMHGINENSDDEVITPMKMADSEIPLPCSNISTPKLGNESLSPESQKEKLHYLFQGVTPILKEFTILVENTPI